MNRRGCSRRGLAGRFLPPALLLAVLGWAVAASAAGPQVSRVILSNGATLLVSEQHNLPMVVVSVLVDAGARLDPHGRAGLAYLTADLLTEGTTTRSASEISRAVDSIGASLSSSAGADSAVISLRVLRKDLDIGLELMADVLLRPAFARAELERRREAVLAAIRAEQDDPTRVAMKAFRNALFRDEPYGHPAEGTEASVPRLTRKGVRAFFGRYYHPGRAILVVVGDVTQAEITARLERALAGWKGNAGPAFEYGEQSRDKPRSVRIDKPVTQAAIVMGHRGIARNDPDYEVVSVMNYVLGGGGFSSRLTDQIRTRTGLAYSVASYFDPKLASGGFQIVMQTKNESVSEAIGIARREVQRMRTEMITEAELNDAKKYLTGSFPLRLDSNRKIAQFVSEVAFYQLGPEYADRYLERIRAVTREDVLRAAKQYLHPDRFLETVVADFSKADLAPASEAGGP